MKDEYSIRTGVLEFLRIPPPQPLPVAEHDLKTQEETLNSPPVQ
jgi:hypothetical protein